MKPSVALEVDGKAYELRLTMNAVIQMESMIGKSLGAALRAMRGGDFVFGDIRGLVFAALKDRQPDTTLQDAGDIVDTVGITPVLDALKETVDLYFNGGTGKNATKPTAKGKEKK